MQLFGEMYARRMIRTWLRDRPNGWELTSRSWSPFYFMFREVPSVPSLFHYSVEVLTTLVDDLATRYGVDALVGVASTGIPLAAGVALMREMPLLTTRKVAGIRTVEDLDRDRAGWGEHALVEGCFADGMRYVLVDDVVTGGASKRLARSLVEREALRRNCRVTYAGTIVVVDRGYPAEDQHGLGIVSGHRFYDDVEEILKYGGTRREVAVIRRYLESPHLFQSPDHRAALCEEVVGVEGKGGLDHRAI